MRKLGMVKNWPFHPGTKLPTILTVRWLGQIGDGIFQSALASFVLFSPQRQPNAVSAATAFALVLLPYSLIGPYAGVFLDRFSRQRIVQFSNLVRAADLILITLLIKSSATGIPLTLLVLVAFGVNRLILSGLSAGLPLIVTSDELISANALAITGGSIGVVIGGGVGILLKKLFDSHSKSDLSDAKVILIAMVFYLLSSLFTSRLYRRDIGPAEHEIPVRVRGVSELKEGLRILRGHPDALRGIFATAIQRGGLTALTLMGLLLERNTFNPPSNPDAGLAGFAYALGVAGVGFGVGSFITPFFVNYFGRHRWIRIMMVTPTLFLILFAFMPHEWLLITTAFFIATSGQAVKVTNDALVQSQIVDEFRGRVFAFYDVVVNGIIVLGAIIAAWILPMSGRSPALPLLTSGCFAATSLFLLKPSKFFIARPSK
jgi:MFS family permease